MASPTVPAETQHLKGSTSIPLHHQRLTEAIAAAYLRGDNAKVDALLIAKQLLIRREADGATATPTGLKGT